MSVVVRAGDEDADAVGTAVAALKRGDLVVLPTDTVYGVAADAFEPAATGAVFEAKARPRSFPLPVLVHTPKQLLGLCTVVPEPAERLMAAYWPGPCTIVVPSDPNLRWDLGRSEGTVAVRMPLDEVALAIIKGVGPLACTSANRSGQPAARTAEEAERQLGDAVAVYVDDGTRDSEEPSSIVDLTRSEPYLLREGTLDPDEVLAVARGDLDPLDVAVDGG